MDLTNSLLAREEQRHRIEQPALPRPWWHRSRLGYLGHDLWFADRKVTDLAHHYGAPLLVYDRQRIQENVARLADALEATGLPSQLYYATKANRFGPVLGAIRETRRCGIDCASPGEVELALSAGFRPEEISFTASCVGDRDIERIGGLGIRMNVDSISMLHKLGRRFPGRRIGLRVNPQIGVGMSGNLTYAGARPSKFGIYADRFEEALAVARSYDFTVEGVHMHVGSGWLSRGMETFLRAVDRLVDFADCLDDLTYINVGGGIGVPHSADDEPVDVALYARCIASVVRERLGDHVQICCEPGDYLVNDASILIALVNMVEEKGGETFVGLNVGFNAHPQAAHYGFVQEIAHAHRGPARSDDPSYFVVGHINEVIDNFEEDARLPHVEEGDLLVMLNAGGYGSSMASYHCMRSPARELMLR